jgi:uncharacterized delta-60 repeat protein
MKHLLPFLLLLLSSTGLHSQRWSLDSAFASEGMLIGQYDSTYKGTGAFREVIPDSVGACLVLGGSLIEAQQIGCVMRLREDGERDLTYGLLGKALISPFPGPVLASAMCRGEGHTAWIAGHWLSSDGDSAMVFVTHLFTDGMPDTSFGVAGYALLNVPADALVAAPPSIALMPDGGMVVAFALAEDFFSTCRMTVWRLDADGNSVPGFGAGGTLEIGSTGKRIFPQKVLSAADSLILICGAEGDTVTSTQSAVIYRLLPDGSEDLGWGSTGRVLPFASDFSSTALDMVGLADGRLLLCGARRSIPMVEEPLVWKLESSGDFDTTFATGGVRVLDWHLEEAGAVCLEVTLDGGCWVTGMAVTLGKRNFVLQQLLPDGSDMVARPDTGKWFLELDFAGAHGSLFYSGMALDSLGRLLACGGSAGDLSPMSPWVMRVKDVPAVAVDDPLATIGEVKLFPNPSSGPLFLAVNLPQAGTFNISVTDSRGASVMLQTNVHLPKGLSQVSLLDATALPVGIYRVSIVGSLGRWSNAWTKQ